MKIIVLLNIILFSQVLLASELIFTDGQKKYYFDFNQKNMLIISKNCNNKCDAFKVLQNIKFEKFKSGGANPGAVICEDQLHGNVLILTDTSKDQTGFCQFLDKSLIALGSLQAIALKNNK